MGRVNLKKFANEIGLTYDKKHLCAYGSFQGYQMLLDDVPSKKVFVATFNVNGGTPEQAQALNHAISALAEPSKAIQSWAFQENTIVLRLQTKGNSNYAEILKDIFNRVAEACRNNSMRSSCKFCGTNEGLGFYRLPYQAASICPNCFERAKEELDTAQQDLKVQKSNIAGGIVGALLGSFIGVALWVIVYQMGYIAGIVGFVMAVCCMKGYELLGGKLNLPGIIISLLIAVGMLFFAENIALALEIYNEYKADFDITFFDAFRSVSEFLKEPDIMSAFVGDLAFGYLLMAAASASSIISTYKNANLKYDMERLGN